MRVTVKQPNIIRALLHNSKEEADGGWTLCSRVLKGRQRFAPVRSVTVCPLSDTQNKMLTLKSIMFFKFQVDIQVFLILGHKEYQLWFYQLIAISILNLMHGKSILPDPGDYAVLSRLPLFVLTLQFYPTLLFTTPSPAHTPALWLHWMLRSPSGYRKWHTCILPFLCLSLPFYRRGMKCEWDFPSFCIYLVQSHSVHIKMSLLCCTMCGSSSGIWVCLFSAFKSCYFSHRCQVFVFVCVSTFPEPCPSNQHTAHQEHGKISD